MKKQFQTGFTLIELLVVITVIGLLSAMILVGLSGVRSQGRDTRRVADLRNTQNALEIYFNKSATYPAGGSWASLEQTLRGAGIGVSKLPSDPLDRTPYLYSYAVSGDGLHYVMSATLETTDSQLLKDDVDTAIYVGGINCTDPVYCVEL